jgi:putative transposase
MREVFHTILYLNRSGCQWGMLPHDRPAKSTVDDHFAQWRDDGTWPRIMDALRRDMRVAEGREPSPGAASIDSQTVKGAEVGGERGYDGGKKLNGRKRHIMVDTLGLVLVQVTRLIVSLTKRTEPSPMPTFTPPGWRLPAVNVSRDG